MYANVILKIKSIQYTCAAIVRRSLRYSLSCRFIKKRSVFIFHFVGSKVKKGLHRAAEREIHYIIIWVPRYMYKNIYYIINSSYITLNTYIYKYIYTYS